MAVEFGVLGPVQALLDGSPVDLGHARQRCVLGVLLVEAGRPVPIELLVDRVWGTDAPQRASAALYSYLSRLRRALAAAPEVAIGRQSAGYLLTVDPDAVDLHRFGRLVTAARTASSDDAAADYFAQALGLWRGEPFAGLDTPWLASTRHTLANERWAATLDQHDVLMRLGRHGELLPALSDAVTEHPLDERLAEQYLLALYRCGRQADAHEQYRRIRHDLAEELGSDPGASLQRLQERILAADPTLAAPADEVKAPPPAEVPAAAAPAHLPADVRAFTGRTRELALLDRLLEPTDGDEPASLAVLSGTAGVGKSALAVRWAHRVRAAFPDGQLHVNLRGYDAEQPVTAAEALASVLTALGVRGPELPADVDARAGLFRSMIAGRRMLVLLDNASSVEQVRPLLPGTGSSLVLITSRDALPGMVAVHGAQRITLDLLPPSDAIGLLRRLIGVRVDREPGAAAELAAACARLPLALRIAAELAADRADVPLAELVAELADQRRLDMLDAGGDPRAEVRAVFSWSYRNLPTDAARLFRLLGLHPGVNMHVDAAAALTGGTAGELRRLLGVLSRASLIQPSGTGRYSMHDLLREYAAELAQARDPADDRAAALTRVFDHYLAASSTAMNALYPPEPGTVPSAPPGTGMDPERARRWIEAERPNLAATCTYGAVHGWPRHAVELAETLFRYLDAGGPVAEAVTVTAAAVAAAGALGDRAAQASALTNLGRLHRRHGSLEDSAQTYRQALALYAALHDRDAEAGVWRELGSVQWRLGRYRQAAEHYQQALSHFEQLGDEPGQADALVRLALVDERLGNATAAAHRLEPALALFTQLGDQFSTAYVTSLLARLRPDRQRLDAAAMQLELSLSAVHRAGDLTRETYALTDLAAIDARRGAYADAAGHYGAALLLHRQIGDRASEAETLNDLGQVLQAGGDAAAARARYGEALSLAQEIGDRYEQARAYDGIAETYESCGEPGPAGPNREQAKRLFGELAVPAVPALRAPATSDH